MYLAIVLDRGSQDLMRVITLSPQVEGWDLLCHHVTICMGSDSKGKYPFTVGEVVDMSVIALGEVDGVLAGKITLPDGKFTKNKNPHCTMAVDRGAGAKPAHSNKITSWSAINPFTVRGTVTLCE